MKETVTLVIDGDAIRYVHDDDIVETLAEIGPRSTRRASTVEPDGDGWIADMTPVGGPVMRGPRRADLIASEVKWLEANAAPWPIA
jgi:hypothetical protein